MSRHLSTYLILASPQKSLIKLTHQCFAAYVISKATLSQDCDRNVFLGKASPILYPSLCSQIIMGENDVSHSPCMYALLMKMNTEKDVSECTMWIVSFDAQYHTIS